MQDFHEYKQEISFLVRKKWYLCSVF